MMLCRVGELHLPSRLRSVRLLFLHLLLTHVCRGQSQPIVASLGGDVILPCDLGPAVDAADLTLEWTRPDLDPRFVHVCRSGQELVVKTHKWFEGRTSLLADELPHGNISLKLSEVTLTDEGTYRCFIPALDKLCFVRLAVGAASSPAAMLAGLDRDRGGVVLQCEAAGWYPEPEVLWLDAEGTLLPAGPTETARGPDALYTVSSRLTVESSSSFTCRVQQRNINQTREAQIHVPDDFLMFPSGSAAPVITGLAVCLAGCIVFILAGVLFVYKWRLNLLKAERGSKTERTETGGEREELLPGGEAVQMNVLRGTDETPTQEGPEEDKLVEAKDGGMNTSEEFIDLEKDVIHNHREEAANKNSQLEGKPASRSWFPYPFSGFLKRQPPDDQQRTEEAETEEESRKTQENDQQSADVKRRATSEDLQETTVQLESETTEPHETRTRLDQTQRHVDKLIAEYRKLKEEKQQLQTNLDIKTDELRVLVETKEELQKTKEELESKSTLVEELRKILKQQLQREQEETHLTEMKELVTKNEEWQQKLQEKRTKPETGKNEAETKSELSRPESQDQNSSNLVCQSSTTGYIVLQIDPWRKYIRLENMLHQDQHLRGWKLHLQINDTEPVICTFDWPVALRSEGKVTVWCSGCGIHQPSNGNLVWKDLKPWGATDRLHVSLQNNGSPV